MLYIKPSVALIRAQGKIQPDSFHIIRMLLHRHGILISSIVQTKLNESFL